MTDRRRLTPWFPATIWPARIGWYECKYRGSAIEMRWWDSWGWKRDPSGEPIVFATCPGSKWRGLAEPKGSRIPAGGGHFGYMFSPEAK